jgi:hypothetical protein
MIIRKVAAATFVALTAFAFTLPAVASGPWTFGNRAKFEAYVKNNLYYVGMRKQHAKIKTVGCAKAGLARAVCSVITISPTKGVQAWTMAMSCPSEQSPPTQCRFWWYPVEIRS